jgi:CHAT domain-containing protein
VTGRAVLAEYWLGDDETLLFIGRDDLVEPRVERIPVGRAALLDAATAAPGGPDPVTHPERLQDVYGPVIAPIRRWTEPGDLVWLVPHQVLHQLPLHALELDGEGPLIARNPVCYTPSASVMVHARSRPRRPVRHVVAFADSRADQPLLHADAQVDALARTYGTDSVRVHRGAGVTRDAVVEGLTGGADMVHVACHGVFDAADPLGSGFLLAGAESDRFTAADFLRLRCDAGLVTLSACESGVSARRAGDELIGLTRAILYAGIPSIVVSLWRVDEISTGILMRRFYEELAAGEHKATALQRAQLRVRAMAADEVIAYCAAIRPGADPPGQRLIDQDIADLRFIAGDFAAALTGYEHLSRSGPPDAELHAAITRCRRAMRAAGPPDYTTRPFAAAHYWAPFILVGDWQ